MYFSKSTIAVAASLVSLGLAADPLSFTSWPKAPLEPGKPVTLTWTGGASDEPVTILLRQGSAGNLQDVKPITGQATGGTFTWTPDESVKKSDTYAFQIKQKDQTNYTALLKGGTNPAAALPEAKEAKDTTETGAATTTAATTSTTTGTTTGTTTDATTDATTGATDSTTAPNTQTTGGTTESTQATQTTMTSTASKALISSSASASGSPSSSAAASSSDSLSATRTVVHGKQASSTESAQTGAASIPQCSVQLVLGIAGLLAYLV